MTYHQAWFRHVASLTLAALLSLATVPAICAEIAGISFEEKTSLGGTDLVLNGVGLRTKLVFKVYAIGLYLPQKADTAAAVLASAGPRSVRIVTLRELSADQLADSLSDGLKKNLSKADLDKLGPRIEAFRSTMLAIGKSAEKTQIHLDFLPASGTTLSVGGEAKGQAIPGEDFYTALLRIWIGESPAQESVRDALLGKKA